jgi:hypothetical protein
MLVLLNRILPLSQTQLSSPTAPGPAVWLKSSHRLHS